MTNLLMIDLKEQHFVRLLIRFIQWLKAADVCMSLKQKPLRQDEWTELRVEKPLSSTWRKNKFIHF